MLQAVQRQVLEPLALQLEMHLRRQLPAAREAAGAAAESSAPRAGPLGNLKGLLRAAPLQVCTRSVHIR